MPSSIASRAGDPAAASVDQAPPSTATEASFDDWAWMKEITNGDCWTTLDLDEERPHKSLDFGANGYTASINLGHELLQLTAPDSRCGVVSVRGSYSNWPDAILARAQRRIGGKSTFGLKLLSDSKSDYTLEPTDEQGFLNFRWPCIEYDLKSRAGDSRTGTCIAFSFVKDGVVYQILRLEPGRIHRHHRNNVRDGDEGYNREVPEIITVTDSRSGSSASDDQPLDDVPDRHAKIRLGGRFRIGCSCQNNIEGQRCPYSVQIPSFADPHVITCSNFTYGKRLEMQLFVNGKKMSMPLPEPPPPPPVPIPLYRPRFPDVTSFQDALSMSGERTHDAEKDDTQGSQYNGEQEDKNISRVYKEHDYIPFPPSPSTLRVSHLPPPPLDVLLPDSRSNTDLSAATSTKSGVTSDSIDKVPEEPSSQRQTHNNGPSFYIPPPPPPPAQTEVDAVYDTEIILKPGKVTLVVATFTLRDITDYPRPRAIELPSSQILSNYLGIDETSPYASDKLWLDRINLNGDNDYYDLCTSAACLEQILSVTSLPMQKKELPPPPIGKLRSEPRDSLVPSVASIDSAKSRENDEQHGVDPAEDAIELSSHKLQALKATQSMVVSSEIVLSVSTSDLEKGGSAVTSKSPAQEISPKTALVENSGLARTSKPSSLCHDVQPNIISSLHEQADKDTDMKSQGENSSHPHPAHSVAIVDKEVPPNESLVGPVSPDTPAISQGVAQINGHDPDFGIALLRDIVGNQDVDLQRSFWQIRFLVKSYIFLAVKTNSEPASVERNVAPSLNNESSIVEEARALEVVRSSYLDRINFHIHHALIWIISVLRSNTYGMSPATYPFGSLQPPRIGCFPRPYAENDVTLYPFITVWYVIYNLKDALPASFYVALQKNLFRLSSQASAKEESLKADQSSKLSLLLWYHYGCLSKIYQTLMDMSIVDKAITSEDMRNSLKKAREWRKKAEKSMAATRKTQIDAYSDKEEASDRLAFLAVELGLISPQDDQLSLSCSSQARRRILERQNTTTISSNAPWELSCINHHNRLALSNDLEKEEDDAMPYRKNCLKFLTTSFSYLPSWNINSAARYWDLDASCLICATVLDIRMNAKAVDPTKNDDEAPNAAGLRKNNARRNSVLPSSPSEEKHAEGSLQKTESRYKRDEVNELLLEQLKRQLEQQAKLLEALNKDSGTTSPFDWTRWKPPSVLHPDIWVQSLDDTPEVFQSSQTKTVSLRTSIRQYLVKNDRNLTPVLDTPAIELTPPDWTLANIANQFDLDELIYISVFDILLWRTPPHDSYAVGRLKRRSIFFDLPPWHWIGFLDGLFHEKSPAFNSITPAQQTMYLNHRLRRGLLNDEDFLSRVKQEVKDEVLSKLNDSLVDRDTRSRIFFIKRCSPSIVKAFIYMWHTHAIDTFDNHFRNSSSFFDFRGGTWTSSITLSYWAKKAPNSTNIFDEGRDSAPFPPSNVRLQRKEKLHWWQSQKPKEKVNKEIEEGCTSLVLSSDQSGDRWICTLISTILLEGVIEYHDIQARNTFHDFIYQPATGRCLVFLLYLGVLCQSLAEQYEYILSDLTIAIKLGRQVLREGLDWEHEEDAIQRLKSMLWALEALRIFDDRLSESIDRVKEAKERMLKYLEQAPGKRAEHLERKCQARIEEFEKKYGRLEAVHLKIEQKIVQISRYREGISAVSNLEDTHTALKQNDTIRILTYITIAYLPLSFVAALFSTSIVTDSWTGTVFGVMTLLFLALTFVLARSLGIIIKTWDKLTKRLGMMLEKGNGNEKSDADSSASKGEPTPINSGTTTALKTSQKWPLPYLARRRHKQAEKVG